MHPSSTFDFKFEGLKESLRKQVRHSTEDLAQFVEKECEGESSILKRL